MSVKADQFMDVISQLREAGIAYSVHHNRIDAISIQVYVPGERWEIDFVDDASIDVEVFISDGKIYDDTKLKELFSRFSD